MTAHMVPVSVEEREESERIIRENVELAFAKIASGRSSMPIRVDELLILAGLAAAYLEVAT